MIGRIFIANELALFVANCFSDIRISDFSKVPSHTRQRRDLMEFKHRILLVDDEVIITTQIEEVLRSEGYRVVGIETSGQDAITAAQTLAPDIVVMDIMMPGKIDGIAAARKIMDQMGIPVLFLTAYADEKMLTRTKPLDPFGYVLKPVQEKQLIVAIELALYKKTMEDRLLETYQQLAEANQKLTQEIENHKKARQALQINNAKYRTLVDNIPDIIYSLNSKGQIRTTNAGIWEHYGYRDVDIVGRSFMALVHPDDRQRLACDFEDALETQSAQTRGDQFRIMGSNGETYWFERNAHLSFDKDGHFIEEQGVLRDITTQKHLQEQLIRSERLSATGQLAASIAHEINSPLQAVTLMLNTLRTKYRRDKKLRQNVRLISDAFDSIKDTVKTLIYLTRPSQAARQLVAINTVVADAVQLIKFDLLQYQIKIDLQLAQDLPMITAAPQQLGHVILALVNNAIEALTSADAIDTSGVADRPAKTITLATSTAAGNIVLTVADTGPGIPATDRNRIFDPFFTRKKPMGLGIGLSVCDGIVKDHHGVINAENAPLGGALFTIQLPIQPR